MSNPNVLFLVFSFLKDKYVQFELTAQRKHLM